MNGFLHNIDYIFVTLVNKNTDNFLHNFITWYKMKLPWLNEHPQGARETNITLQIKTHIKPYLIPFQENYSKNEIFWRTRTPQLKHRRNKSPSEMNSDKNERYLKIFQNRNELVTSPSTIHLSWGNNGGPHTSSNAISSFKQIFLRSIHF